MVAIGFTIAAGISRSQNLLTDQEIVFTFAPPDGTKFLLTETTVREVKLGNVTQRQEYIERKISNTVRQTVDGYSFIAKTVSFEWTRNGKTVPDYLLEPMRKAVWTYRVNDRGRLLKIEGYKETIEAIRNNLPPEVIAFMNRNLDARTLEERAFADWNSKIARLAGRKISIGGSITLPKQGQDIDYQQKISALNIEPCPANYCVGVRIESRPPDNFSIEEFFGANSGLIELNQISDLQQSEITTWVIAPDNMLIYSGKTTRTLDFTLELTEAKVRVPVSFKQESQLLYDYSQID